LLLAGPPDVLKAEDPAAAIEGRTNGTLIVVSAADGKPLAQYPLDSPPVLDGMAAAGGSLYMATTSGKILTYREDR